MPHSIGAIFIKLGAHLVSAISPIHPTLSRGKARFAAVLVGITLFVVQAVLFFSYSSFMQLHWVTFLFFILIQAVLLSVVWFRWLRWDEKTNGRYEILGPIILTLLAASAI